MSKCMEWMVTQWSVVNRDVVITHVYDGSKGKGSEKI